MKPMVLFIGGLILVVMMVSFSGCLVVAHLSKRDSSGLDPLGLKRYSLRRGMGLIDKLYVIDQRQETILQGWGGLFSFGDRHHRPDCSEGSGTLMMNK